MAAQPSSDFGVGIKYQYRAAYFADVIERRGGIDLEAELNYIPEFSSWNLNPDAAPVLYEHPVSATRQKHGSRICFGSGGQWPV